MAYSLEEMEKYLQDMYEKAGKGLEQKAVQYMIDFQRLEEQHKRDVESGKWTQDEFDTWRKNKLLYGTHWTRMIQTVQRDMAKVNQTALDYINGKIPQIFAQTYNEVAEKVPKSSVSGYSFELVNADTVKNLIHEEGIILPPKKNLDKQKDKLWNAKQVNAQLLQGILQGESIKKIAARMQNVANADLVGATRTARTMCTAAENSGRQSAYNRAAEDGIKFTKTWVAALQGNTRDTHKYLNQQTQPHDKPFESSSGAVLMFPGDWHAPPAEVYNCRCTMITNFIGFDKIKLKEAVKRQEADEKGMPASGSKSSSKKKENKEVNYNNKEYIKNRSLTDNNFNKLLDILVKANVEYNRVEFLDEDRSEKEIINYLGGFDRTDGSCASLALAYIGQKQGYDVLDFRGGVSREQFAQGSNLKLISQMNGIVSYGADGEDTLTHTNNLLKLCKPNKEYFLSAAGHAAIVKRTSTGLKHLDLQSDDPKWIDFSENIDNTLVDRFHCTKKKKSEEIISHDFIIDIEASAFGKDFRTLLGYLNSV